MLTNKFEMSTLREAQEIVRKHHNIDDFDYNNGAMDDKFFDMYCDVDTSTILDVPTAVTNFKNNADYNTAFAFWCAVQHDKGDEPFEDMDYSK